LDPSETLQERAVIAQWTVDPLDWVTGEMLIESASDSLAEDDRVVFSLPPQVPGQVKLLADSLFLREALSPEVMQGRWQLSTTEPSEATNRGSDKPQAADMLCVESKTLTDSTVRDTVRDALSAGRGVMLFVDRATPVIAGFLRDLGIEMELPDDSPSAQSDPIPATFRYVFMEHPIFAPFQSSAFGNLAEVEISRYRKLSIREAIPLAFAASGDPLVFEVNAGPGRMLVFAFAFNRDDTNWPIHPSFIPFLDKTLGYLRHQPDQSNAFEPGQSVAWEAPGGQVDGKIQVEAIDTDSLRPRGRGESQVAAEVRDGRANFQIPAETGHYGVRWEGDDQLVAILDVNPSPLESDLTYAADPEAVNAWRRESVSNGQATANNPPTNGLELTRLEALQQHVWWYLLLAAFAAFLLETAFSSRRVQQAD
jgi:hypothetical protein